MFLPLNHPPPLQINQIVNSLINKDLASLLNRSILHLDLQSAKKKICGRVVLVTGAAGSIGSELCQQILNCSPALLICIDRNENGIFRLRSLLASMYSPSSVVLCVTDIANVDELNIIFRKYLPAIVFHAAAYKHLSLMEQNVPALLVNNVFNLCKLLEVVRDNHCESLVFISTDKAVNPTSLMGATKRIGEIMIASQPKDGPRCLSVRFGNVLFSSGSVAEVFLEKIYANEPLTINHPDAQRFFMSCAEAASLLLQSYVVGLHNDILVLEIGDQIRIFDLAETLIRISGKDKTDVVVNFANLEEGEKIREELFYSNEQVFPTIFPNIKRVRSNLPDPKLVEKFIQELFGAVYSNDIDLIRTVIQQIVPQYSYTLVEGRG